jgi:hypothetical protein
VRVFEKLAGAATEGPALELPPEPAPVSVPIARPRRRQPEVEAETVPVAEEPTGVAGAAADEATDSEEPAAVPKKPRQAPVNLESRLESLTRMYTADQAREDEPEEED